MPAQLDGDLESEAEQDTITKRATAFEEAKGAAQTNKPSGRRKKHV